MISSLRRALVWLTGAASLFAASTRAADLVPNTKADAKFKEIERSIFLYDQKPYTIEEAVEKNDVAGLSVVLIYDGKPAVHRTYGYRIERKKERATNKTIYQCASMSKMVSSLGVVTAARLGQVQLDQPVTEFNAAHPNTLLARWAGEYFEGEKASWARDITLRRLLSHSAGLDVHGISAAPWLPSKEPLENILFGKSVFKAAVKPLDEPGLTYRYSGGGVSVAEAWLEIATGRKFEDYLEERVLDPLGMSQSTYETGSENTPHLAWGCSHGICLYNVRTLDVKAAGGLLCHPVDYARLVALLMNGGKEYLPRSEGAERIPSRDVAELFTPSKSKDSGLAIRGDGEGHGLGVKLDLDHLLSDGLSRRFSHGGVQQGFSNDFYANRERKVGIVVMVNGARQWSKQKEEYGGMTLRNAVVKAFKVAYGLADASGPLLPRCSADTDCGEGQYCNAGGDFVANSCEPLKRDNALCELLGGGHQCTSGHCKNSRCYTPDSVPMNGPCYVDDACQDGTCSSVVPGTQGSCVCNDDHDCGSGKWCNGGADTTKNSCELLKADNTSCDLVGGGHQCTSGYCAYARCYTPSSVPLGGTCYLDAACDKGKCSSLVPGTQGACVCQADSDCGSGWCDRGVDGHPNACHAKLPKGAVCGTVGDIGVGHRCQSGECKVAGFSTKLECK